MKINYTNYKGVNADRNIIPLFLYRGSNKFHPEKQWLLKAWDIDKKAMRSFAVRDIKEPRFTRYKREMFGGWDLDFPDWFISWEWEKSEKYGYEWEFSIKKLNHTYNDSRLPDTLFSIASCEVFTWLPTEVSFSTPYKELSILGLTFGILIKNIFFSK
jgi:predicted DNA-binding transcriptional regulator YafY